MNYNMLTGTMESEESFLESDPFSVYQAFEQVQDGRYKRGVRYSVAQILTLIVLVLKVNYWAIPKLSVSACLGTRQKGKWQLQASP